MADPHGFLTHRQRENRPSRPVPVRILDWQEVHGFTPEEIARYQKIVESTSRKICYFC